MAIKEHDLPFEGTTIHWYEGGKGYPILMSHGSGPGSGSEPTWPHVLGPLSRRYHVVAMDLIGYGKSGRKPKKPYFDLDLWSRQWQFMLDRVKRRGPVGLIGHSLSGYLMLRLASNNPRVNKVITSGSLGAKYKGDRNFRVAWEVPKNEKAFLDLYKTVTVNPKSFLTKKFIRERLDAVYKDGYDKYFGEMYKGDKQRYLGKCVLTKAELKRLKCEVLLLHGAHDKQVPFRKAGIPLADSIPQADFIRLAKSGHPPHLDEPQKWLQIVTDFFG